MGDSLSYLDDDTKSMLFCLLLQFESVNEAVQNVPVYKTKFKEIKVGLVVKW